MKKCAKSGTKAKNFTISFSNLQKKKKKIKHQRNYEVFHINILILPTVKLFTLIHRILAYLYIFRLTVIFNKELKIPFFNFLSSIIEIFFVIRDTRLTEIIIVAHRRMFESCYVCSRLNTDRTSCSQKP